MSDLIDEFGVPVTFKRYIKPTVVKGQAVKPTEAAGPWTMTASIQSMGTFEALNLPEGMRNRDAQKVFTDTLLQVADEDTGQIGDRFVYRGKMYEVWQSADWLDTDLPYYKFIALKVNKA